MTATPAWLAVTEALFNRGISGSAEASSLAARLDATGIRVDIQGLIVVHAGVTRGRLALVAAGPAAAGDGLPDAPRADATISGSPAALLRLARGASHDRGAAAEVRGDAEIANAYRQLFALARPDLEEEMSRVVGDFPARRLSQFAARTLDWARRTRRTAGENISEYLQEESRDLVNKTELDEFLQGVDMLRETADRIEARLKRLEQRLGGSST